VGDVVGLDDVLVMILLFPPEQANSRQHIAAVIGDDLHRYPRRWLSVPRWAATVSPLQRRQHSERKHLDIVMVGAVAFAA